MKNDKTKQNKLVELKGIAEESLKGKSTNQDDYQTEDINKLIHNLRVYQTELEMQNEELRRIQQELEESRDRYSDLYDFAPVGYFTIDKNGIIREVNLTGASILGVERASLIGKPLSHFVVKNDQDSLYLHYRDVLSTKKHQTCELVLIGKDKTRFYSQLESTVINCDEDESILYRTIISNITTRRLAEEALKEAQEDLKEQVSQQTKELMKSNELLQFETTEHRLTEDELMNTNELLETIFLTTHLMIAYMDINFSFTRVNRAYAMANGYSTEFFIGKNYFDLYPDNDSEIIFKNVIKSGKPYFGYAEHFKFSKLKESEVEYWDWSLHPIKDSSKNIKGLILLFLDVTERKRMEEQLQWSQRMESVGRLAAGVAHEIGNPLNSISSLVQLLLMRSKDTFVKENLELMGSHIDRISKIVRNMVDFAHPIDDKKKLIQVNDLIKATLEMSKYDKRAKNIEIITELASNMHPVFLVSDQLSQVFTNIIFNAFDAMKGDGRLTIGTKEELDNVYISFTDTGMGMKDDTLRHIFDPFFTTKESGQGTGLGLSISYGIIKSFDGEIEVQSVERSGTTFTVIIPIRHIEKNENG